MSDSTPEAIIAAALAAVDVDEYDECQECDWTCDVSDVRSFYEQFIAHQSAHVVERLRNHGHLSREVPTAHDVRLTAEEDQ